MATARFQVVSLPRPIAESQPLSRQDAKARTGQPSSPQPASSQPSSSQPPPPRRFTWRFLAANNRSLATATGVFPDAASCIAAMHDLNRGLATAVCEFFRDEDGLWRWTVRLGGDVAASSHSYRRQVRARMTADTFFALAAEPAAVDNVQVVYR